MHCSNWLLFPERKNVNYAKFSNDIQGNIGHFGSLSQPKIKNRVYSKS